MVTSFNLSEFGCIIDQIPTTFGLFLFWIATVILQSAKVKKATEIIISIIKIKDKIVVCVIFCAILKN